MGTLNIYKGLSEEYRTIKGNASVTDLAHELYPELDLTQCIILNAGEEIAPDYVLKDNDIVFIRVIPGSTGAIIMAVIAVVCAAVAVGAAVYSSIEQQKAQEEMEKAQKQAKALAEKVTQLPFLKGANNRTALGYNIPYIMGSVYDVPYKLVAGYYTISGENGANQFWNVVLVAGFNNALIQDVSIGTKVVKKPNATIEIPGQVEEFSYLEDSGANPYYFENDCPFYDPADKLDVKYSDEVVIDGLNEKVSCISFSDELDYNNAVVKQAATNTYKFDVCILFNGLRRYDDGWKSKSVSVKVEWSNNGSTWNNAGNIVTGEINSRKQVRFSKTVTLKAAQCVGKDIQIRLTRITALEESNSQETCYLCYINCWQYDAAKSTSSAIVSCSPLEQPWRGRTTRLALRIISNESTQDNLDQININAYGKARIWNNDAWTVNKYPTRNPASWVLEIMTSDVHPHSRYNDDEIDLEALGAVYTYCEQNDFYCDGILTEDTKKADVLNNILSECNTTMYRDDATGKWTFAIERAQSTPVALLNEQCIKSVTVTKTFERKPYAVKTTFTNRESWAVDTFYQTVNGKVDSSTVYGEHKIIVENAPKYITTFDHAYKYTRRMLAKQQLQPREVTVQVGRDGDYYPLYSKVMLQMKQLKIGLSNGIIHGAIVKNGLLTQIITSDFCDFSDANARYGLIIQAQTDIAKEHLYIEVEPQDPAKCITRNVKLSIPLAVNAVPEYGNIYSFGYLNESGQFSRVTNEMMIYNRKQNSDGWELLLKDYNSAIFQFGDIPEYQTNLTTPKESGSTFTEAIMQKIADIAEAIDNLESGNVPVGKPDIPTLVAAVAGKDGLILSCVQNGDGLRNDLRAIVFTITKADGTTATISVSGRTAAYTFDREVDGYPEKADLADWTVSARAVNIYGKESVESEARPVSTALYGTWQLSAPVITKRESNRVITLYFEQPTRSDGLERYGNIQHRVQIKRVTAPTDSSYFKPATSANPYESEENYKDGNGYVIAGESYAQTLPLAGQDLADPIPEDTTYGFMVVAYNEAGESPAAEINAVAHATSIRDIVENAIGNAQIKHNAVTADKIYVKMLSAIQENLGYITGGIFEGTENNRWALSTITLEDGSTRYEGAMRVGGDDEYFEVEPYNIVNGVPQNYHVKFKAGNFEIAAQASSINGVLYIQANENSLDRTRISPNGTYYQHRETVNSEWQTIASTNVNGVMTKQVFSDDTLFITNQDMTQRRKEGYDIGNAYLSSMSKVYHFDTDIFDQNGTNDLTIEDAPDGSHNLVGADTESDDLDFTPAILAIAPYSTIGKSLYGQYSIAALYGACITFTVDFWIQYIYAENQIIFDIGNAGDKIKLIIAAEECYFEKGLEDESGIPFNAEIAESRLFNLLPLRDLVFNKASDNEIAFNAPATGEAPFESIAVKEYNANYVYYQKTTEAGVDVWTVATVTAATYYALLAAGLYEKTLPFNSTKEAHSYIQHDGQTEGEQKELADIGVTFTPNNWLHIGIIANNTKIIVALNDKAQEFNRYETASAALSVVLNSGKNSFLLDELMIDNTTAEALATFYEHTTNRVPWANLSKSDDYFILTVADLENFKTNIFDTDIFKAKVLEIINEYHS